MAIIDSQSVKIGTLTDHAIGFDGGKQIKGRKRHLLMDTLGLVIMVIVTAANVSDPADAQALFARLKRKRPWFKRLWMIYTDGTYRGKAFVQALGSTQSTRFEGVICLRVSVVEIYSLTWGLERFIQQRYWCSC